MILASTDMHHSRKKIVFFDGVCNLCNGFVNFVMKHNQNRDIFYCSLQSELAQDILAAKSVDLTSLSTIFFLAEDELYSESDAIRKIAQNLDGWPKVLGWAIAIFPKSISNYFYRKISGSRYKIFGKNESCRVPQGWEEDLFID